MIVSNENVATCKVKQIFSEKHDSCNFNDCLLVDTYIGLYREAATKTMPPPSCPQKNFQHSFNSFKKRYFFLVARPLTRATIKKNFFAASLRIRVI